MKRGAEIIATFIGVAIMFAIVFVKAGSQTRGAASQSGGQQASLIMDGFGNAASNVIRSVEGG